MTRPSLTQIATGLILAVGLVGLAAWIGEAIHQRQGRQSEHVSHQQDQEAQQHAQAAQSIPDHAQALQAAQARADAAEAGLARARAALARAKRELAAQPGNAVPVPDGPDSANPSAVDPDPRDAVISSQDVLIVALKGQVGELKSALADEQKRSGEFQQAFLHEQRARIAQEAATEAWKKAVKESKWLGRAQGFAAGVALGYAGGKL